MISNLDPYIGSGLDMESSSPFNPSPHVKGKAQRLSLPLQPVLGYIWFWEPSTPAELNLNPKP